MNTMQVLKTESKLQTKYGLSYESAKALVDSELEVISRIGAMPDEAVCPKLVDLLTEEWAGELIEHSYVTCFDLEISFELYAQAIEALKEIYSAGQLVADPSKILTLLQHLMAKAEQLEITSPELQQQFIEKELEDITPEKLRQLFEEENPFSDEE